MDGKMVLICFFAVISAASLLSNGASAATTYNVGDTLGWNFPPLGAIAYKTWAAQHNFAIGDTLAFNFTTGSHSVAEVSKAAYDSCNTQSPISISNNGPANIKLSSAGEHYYICTFPGHCGAGMKLAINVSATTTTTPTPQPSKAPVSAPTRAPSSSPSTTPSPSSTVATPPSGSSTATPSSSTATPPSGSSTTTPSSSSTPSATPPGGSVPPSPSSASIVAIAAMPFTLLSIAFTLFY